MARRDRYVVGLDVGTSKVAAIVGEMLDDGSLDVVGVGVAESHGIRRGVVVNLEAAKIGILYALTTSLHRLSWMESSGGGGGRCAL